MKEQTDTWDGSQYNKNSALQFDAAINFLHEAHLKGHEAILDIGCGDGKVTREIAALVPQGSVLGIDASPNMLQTAKQFTESNLQFELHKAEALNYHNQFDLITSFFCLQWVSDKLAAFQGIYQALKPGACFLGIFPKVSVLSNAPNIPMTNPEWKKYFTNYPDPFIAPKDTQYDRYATEAHLQLLVYQVKPSVFYFSSREALHGWLYAVTPHLTQIPTEDEKNRFIADAIDCYIKEVPPDANDVYSFHYTIIKMIAKK